MKVLEGNFSFNPKVNKPKKDNNLQKETKYIEQNIIPKEKNK